MQPTDKKLKELKMILDDAENKINSAKRILFEQVYQEQAKTVSFSVTNDANTVEGIFNGEEMIDAAGKKYPVPSNYASKSKLVPGDRLKLVITPEGKYLFKQIGPIDRKHLVGRLTEFDESWQVQVGSKKYQVLQASVTYFKAKPGDEVTIIVPKTGETNWAAIENCLGENLQTKKKKK